MMPSRTASSSSTPTLLPSQTLAPTEAQYLLRIDDLTPGMNASAWPTSGWPALCSLIDRHRLQPILAVVPDNHDPALGLRPPDPQFWPTLRALQSSGATIGLHGYRHLCSARGFGLVPLHLQNEFVGVPEATQSEWIAAGLDILRSHDLHPTLWVAPRHGTDRATVRALRQHGITIISDGFATRPCRHLGCTWIPQQLWQPLAQPRGLWTICLHPFALTPAQLALLDSFVAAHSAQFTSVARLLQEWPIEEPSIGDRLIAGSRYLRHHLRRLRQPVQARRSSSSQ